MLAREVGYSIMRGVYKVFEDEESREEQDVIGSKSVWIIGNDASELDRKAEEWFKAEETLVSCERHKKYVDRYGNNVDVTIYEYADDEGWSKDYDVLIDEFDGSLYIINWRNNRTYIGYSIKNEEV